MRYFFLFALTALLPLQGTDISYDTGESNILDTDGKEAIVQAKALLDQKTTDDILSDHKQLVPTDFQISPYFSPFVSFWFSIYTRYTSDHIVIHDRDNLSIIYAVLDFSQIDQQLNRNARSAVVQKISKEKAQEIAGILRKLARGQTDSRLSLSVLKTLEKLTGPLPLDPSERGKLLNHRANNIRTQTGQRDLIEKGVIRMLPYQNFFNETFARFGLPKQLIAIPFLESSFNTEAHSKVGALGIWQFMPLISSYFVPKRTPTLDYRNNPFISSIAAMHLLRENKMILKSWDMAVTAYNSGTKHLLLARRKHGATQLEDVFTKYQNSHLGFASKNFYAEFLALVHTLTYREDVFPNALAGQNVEMPLFAVSKCSFKPAELIKKFKLNDKLFRELNPHIESYKGILPKGTILVHNGFLPTKIFRYISDKETVKFRPLQWSKNLVNNQSCSTR
jgi:membrane-bound lytic murein transglycosylase D